MFLYKSPTVDSVLIQVKCKKKANSQIVFYWEPTCSKTTEFGLAKLVPQSDDHADKTQQYDEWDVEVA